MTRQLGDALVFPIVKKAARREPALAGSVKLEVRQVGSDVALWLRNLDGSSHFVLMDVDATIGLVKDLTDAAAAACKEALNDQNRSPVRARGRRRSAQVG